MYRKLDTLVVIWYKAQEVDITYILSSMRLVAPAKKLKGCILYLS